MSSTVDKMSYQQAKKLIELIERFQQKVEQGLQEDWKRYGPDGDGTWYIRYKRGEVLATDELLKKWSDRRK